MVDQGVLDFIAKFQTAGGEVQENVTNAYASFSNSQYVLPTLLAHDTFDVYCNQMLESGTNRDLTYLSQVIYNSCQNEACCKPLVEKPYYENILGACSLNTEKMNWNIVKTIKVMVDDKASKDHMLKTCCAGTLSKVSQATHDAELKHLCGKILNGMSGRRSTVTYSEGSIVAVLSTFIENDDDDDELVIEPDRVLIVETPPLVIDESTVNVPSISHDKIDPSWSTFLETVTKDVRDLPENPAMQSVVLAPPKVFTLQTNGTFSKIDVPGLAKIWQTLKANSCQQRHFSTIFRIRLYTFIYLYILSNAPKCHYIPSYTPIYLKILNIKNVRANMLDNL